MFSRHFFAWNMLTSAETQDRRNRLRRKRSFLRTEFDPLKDLSDVEFRLQYRLSKEAFSFLCKELEELADLKGTQQISLQEKVLTALFFYACGSYQRPVGVAKNVCQKLCSIHIQEVTQALINPAMLNKYIMFPKTPADRQAVSQKFYVKYGVPGIVGCVDGSHFKIFTPAMEVEHLFYCRKHYHSLNVQIVCDSEYRILSVNPKFGGASHDAFVWDNSELNQYMQHLHQQGEVCWLLGDSGYPQRPWLMTPFLVVNPGSPAAVYNQKHRMARVVIENTFGRLKNRWRCLSKDRVLHYKPAKCAQIIQACCVLHNIALDFGVPEPEDRVETDHPQPPMQVINEAGNVNDLLRGRAYRDRLVSRL